MKGLERRRDNHGESQINNVLGFRKPAVYLVAVTLVLTGFIGFSLLVNPISLNMAGSFSPVFVEWTLT